MGQARLLVPEMTSNKNLNLGRDFLFAQQMHRDLAQVPYDAEPREHFQGVVGDVHFPPEKSLASGSHKVVMVIVPAFAEGQQGEEPVVLAGVGGLIATRAEQMRKRIDGEGVVPQEDGAQAESPDE